MIIKSQIQIAHSGNTPVVSVELFCSSKADLPDINAIEGIILGESSIARVAGDQFYELKSDGSWIGQDGDSVSAGTKKFRKATGMVVVEV